MNSTFFRLPKRSTWNRKSPYVAIWENNFDKSTEEESTGVYGTSKTIQLSITISKHINEKRRKSHWPAPLRGTWNAERPTPSSQPVAVSILALLSLNLPSLPYTWEELNTLFAKCIGVESAFLRSPTRPVVAVHNYRSSQLEASLSYT